ncbi:Ppx/GppA phosphatase family protein [Lacticaseibacillus suibinensis]|uniref:Ppx/GppA phosphatase family protein n=1 Tax=Lacticaseibacillus suibinensis TaxID=2486011 RepID=UPI000F7971D5|nr:exopolyphosphatase [Lacticaseibacillus suibinensis]
MAMSEHGFVVIGAQSVFFSITNLKTLVEVERGAYPVSIGEDIFATHEIQPGTVDQLVVALQTIDQLMTDYGVKSYEIIGTHSFFEAKNSQFVCDQLFSRTGRPVATLTLSQESYYRTQAVLGKFPHFDQITQKGTVLIDISSGSVELTAFANGEFGFSRNLSLGPLRVFEVMGDLQRTVPNPTEVMRDYIDSRLADFMRLLPKNQHYPHMILMGSALSVFNTLIPSGEEMVETDHEGFRLIYQEVVQASDQYLSDHFDLTPTQTAQVLPTVLLVYRLLKTLNAERVWISNLKLLDGIELSAAGEAGSQAAAIDPTREILISAQNLADRYQVDPKHRDSTVNFALQLFDRLKKLHGLGKRERLLLQIAATVNDVGSYVDTHKHYEHSEYIINSSELMGLTMPEQRMVAAIARYHSSDTPQTDLSDLHELNSTRRLIIAKLSALLRVADSLDASRQQKIQKIRVSIQPTRVLLTATATDDVELERWTLQTKGEFFAIVFGLPIELKGKKRL